MSIPRDPLDSLTPPRLGPDGPDDATHHLRPRAAAGDPETHDDDPTLAGATMSADASDALEPTAATEITDPALFPIPQSPLPPRPRPSFTLAPQVPRPPTAYDAVRSRLQLLPPLLQSHPQALLFAAVGLFLAVVLLITALLAPPLLALLSDTSTTTQPVVVGTARPLATVTAPPSPSPSSPAATFVAVDTRTQGNWQEVYGSAGYVLAGDTQQLPDAIQVTPSGAALYTWAASTDDARAPVKPENPAGRIAACWYAPTSFALDIAITDGQTYQLALYLLDWDQGQRVETVSVVDLSSGAALDTRPARAFATGTYFVWKVRGHVSIQITNAAGSPNAVVSALFFAPA